MADGELYGAADPDSGTVRLTRQLAADRSAVWRALTDAGPLSAWLGRLVGRIDGPGARVHLWHEESVRSGHVVRRWEPEEVLGLTWHFPDEPESRVTFLLSGGPGTTTLTLDHEGVPEAAAYAAGWHRHLDYLAAHLAGRDRSFDDFWAGYDDLLARYRAAGR